MEANLSKLQYKDKVVNIIKDINIRMTKVQKLHNVIYCEGANLLRLVYEVHELENNLIDCLDGSPSADKIDMLNLIYLVSDGINNEVALLERNELLNQKEPAHTSYFKIDRTDNNIVVTLGQCK